MLAGFDAFSNWYSYENAFFLFHSLGFCFTSSSNVCCFFFCTFPLINGYRILNLPFGNHCLRDFLRVVENKSPQATDEFTPVIRKFIYQYGSACKNANSPPLLRRIYWGRGFSDF